MDFAIAGLLPTIVSGRGRQVNRALPLRTYAVV
jgi:hypothetical protein